MQLGYFCTPFFSDDPPPSRTADRLVSNVRTAREAGFDYVELGDHHVTSDGRFLQNVPTAGRLAAEFDHVAVTFLLPLYDPLYVAEYLGTLGAFVDRLDAWPVIGGDEQSFDAVDVPVDERGPRFVEALRLVRRLLSETSVTFDGEFYSVTDVSVEPRADVRWCIGGLSEPAVRRAGRLGDAWAVHPSESPTDVERKLEWFRDSGGGDVVVRRDGLVLEERDAARTHVDELLENGYRGWPSDQDWMVVGSPENAAAEFGALCDLGVDEVVFGVVSENQRHVRETLEGVSAARDQL